MPQKQICSQWKRFYHICNGSSSWVFSCWIHRHIREGGQSKQRGSTLTQRCEFAHPVYHLSLQESDDRAKVELIQNRDHWRNVVLNQLGPWGPGVLSSFHLVIGRGGWEKVRGHTQDMHRALRGHGCLDPQVWVSLDQLHELVKYFCMKNRHGLVIALCTTTCPSAWIWACC